MRFTKRIACLVVIISSQVLSANDDCTRALSNDARELASAIINNDIEKLRDALFTTDREKINRYLYFKSADDNISAEELLDSVIYGQLPKANYYYDGNLDDYKTINPLGLAIKMGSDIEIIELLLRNSIINIAQNISFSEDKTPLDLAIEQGRVDYIEKFLEHKQNYIDRFVEFNSSSILRSAIDNGHTKVVELLLDHPKMKLSKGDLYYAFGSKNENIARVFLNHPNTASPYLEKWYEQAKVEQYLAEPFWNDDREIHSFSELDLAFAIVSNNQSKVQNMLTWNTHHFLRHWDYKINEPIVFNLRTHDILAVENPLPLHATADLSELENIDNNLENDDLHDIHRILPTNPKQLGHFAITPMSLAVQEGNTSVVELLSGFFKLTPLDFYYAFESKESDMIKVLTKIVLGNEKSEHDLEKTSEILTVLHSYDVSNIDHYHLLELRRRAQLVRELKRDLEQQLKQQDTPILRMGPRIGR